ncbi:MAG: uracil-DNA glycosylase, partial [Polyangia bacterium]
LGRDFRVSRERGEWIASELAPFVMATVHPASVLRSPDEATRHAEIERFFADILKASSVL